MKRDLVIRSLQSFDTGQLVDLDTLGLDTETFDINYRETHCIYVQIGGSAQQLRSNQQLLSTSTNERLSIIAALDNDSALMRYSAPFGAFSYAETLLTTHNVDVMIVIDGTYCLIELLTC